MTSSSDIADIADIEKPPARRDGRPHGLPGIIGERPVDSTRSRVRVLRGRA
jgi:hypothetical protein